MLFFPVIISFNDSSFQLAQYDSHPQLKWEFCEEKIDLAALGPNEPILFYDEVGIQAIIPLISLT